MTFTLYHYVHCPFCIRVRMAFGYLNIPYESKVIPYDDEATPLSFTGKKMLPILKHSTGSMNESLDIIAYADQNDRLGVKQFIASTEFKDIEELLTKIGGPVHSLAMPYWIYTPEFNPSSREYFQKKKEVKRGPFKELVKNSQIFTDEVNSLFQIIENRLSPFYQSSEMKLVDILLAAHVWGLYVVPEFQFSEKMHHYLQSVKAQCKFDYHKDFWS